MYLLCFIPIWWILYLDSALFLCFLYFFGMFCSLFLSLCISLLFFVFFSFKRKTAYDWRISDWSSDVCSSDLTKSVHANADAQRGPMTMPKQLDIVRSHIDDALARGGRALVGGAGAVGDRFVQPTLLVDVPEDSIAVTEETFGPTVTVRKVKDMDEAIELANNTRYALGSTVLSKKNGEELDRKSTRL